jgi:UDP-N-acetylglucosamine--N-acetylmuramyl-(pentapeptide) pyrophosphoryl-undecaprenol N-acetylglucosamine transferase
VAAGGTAGHVVPAMAVADELRRRGAQVSWLGTRERIEAELVPAAGYEIDFVKVRGIDRRNPLRAARAGFEALGAVGAARSALRRRDADVVVGGGGYVAGPAGLAATLTRTPLVLTEADSHLGLANRLLARRAARVCLAFPIDGREGDPYLVTGRPVPAAVLGADRARARARFGIGPEERALLVVGGSQGARSVNFAAVEAFAERGGLAVERGRQDAQRGGQDVERGGRSAEHGQDAKRGGRDFAVLHLAGRRDYAELRTRLDAAPYAERYTLLEYEPDLGDVLAAADLVLGRSGGSIFEFTAARRPAVLVPYPFATADHQSANAAWMERGGAATILADDDLGPERLSGAVGAVLDDPTVLERMSTAARALAKPDAAARIADEVLAAAEAKPGSRGASRHSSPPGLQETRGSE